jgi:hypothetical protein
MARRQTRIRQKERRMSELARHNDAKRAIEASDSMSLDERVVRERLGIVRDLLQAQRARRGALGQDPRASLRLALVSFVENAQIDGWTRAFDNVIATARKTAADPSLDADQREELAHVVTYLLEIEPHILRLAQLRKTPTTRTNAPVAPYLRASTNGVPALHDIPGLAPKHVLTNPVPGFVEPGALRHLRALTRDVLDELASLASLRRPAADERWTIGAAFEERLLQVLDAAIALNRGPISLDIVRAARAFADDSPVADPHRWFVPAFLLACTEGERAMDALRQTVLEAPHEMHEGLVDAVCLGSNPDRAAVALSLLEEDDRPEILCIALDVLTRLGRGIEGRFWDLVEHPRTDVALRAITAAAVHSDAPQLVPLLEPLLNREDRAVHVACTLAAVAPDMTITHLRKAVQRGARKDAFDKEIEEAVLAAHVLAAQGQTREMPLMMALAAVTDKAFSALATLGTPEALEYLREEAARRVNAPWRMDACVLPLERMTGIVEADDPTPEGRARARTAWFGEVNGFVIPKGANRSRLGQAFQPGLIVDELRHPETLVQTRTNLVMEARIVGAKSIPIDLAGWLGPQTTWLDMAKQAGWPGSTRRS